MQEIVSKAEEVTDCFFFFLISSKTNGPWVTGTSSSKVEETILVRDQIQKGQRSCLTQQGQFNQPCREKRLPKAEDR